MCHTPGIVAWAISGYKTEKKAVKRVSWVKMLTEGYGLPDTVATGILAGEIPYRVEGDTVVVEVEDEQ